MPVRSLPAQYRRFFPVFLCFFLTAATFARSPLFHDEVGLWTETVKRSPGKQRTHHNLGCALVKAGQYDAAIKAFDAALAQDPDGTILVHFCLTEKGNAHFHLRRYDDAIAAWKQALALSPGNPEILTNIAVALTRQNRMDEALGYARSASSVTPQLAETLSVLGDIHLARREYRLAADRYLAAMERNPGLLSAYQGAAESFEKLGDAERASRYLQAYIARESDEQERNRAVRDLGRLAESQKEK